MTRIAQIIATVAAGCHLTVPHASGIKELPGRVLYGGETLSVDPVTAADLYRARLIHDPETGAPPPAPEAVATRRSGPFISIGGGPMKPMEDNLCMQSNWAATADFSSSEDRATKPPPHNCLGPVIDRTLDTGW